MGELASRARQPLPRASARQYPWGSFVAGWLLLAWGICGLVAVARANAVELAGFPVNLDPAAAHRALLAGVAFTAVVGFALVMGCRRARPLGVIRAVAGLVLLLWMSTRAPLPLPPFVAMVAAPFGFLLLLLGDPRLAVIIVGVALVTPGLLLEAFLAWTAVYG